MSAAEVIAWLESPEGEAWSRARHDTSPVVITVAATCWRSKGRRSLSQDPCGRGAVKVKNAATRRAGP